MDDGGRTSERVCCGSVKYLLRCAGAHVLKRDKRGNKMHMWISARGSYRRSMIVKESFRRTNDKELVDKSRDCERAMEEVRVDRESRRRIENVDLQDRSEVKGSIQ